MDVTSSKTATSSVTSPATSPKTTNYLSTELDLGWTSLLRQQDLAIMSQLNNCFHKLGPEMMRGKMHTSYQSVT
jgi:hypothetical protein